jgi:mannosyl-3-phosphoglycerate phosphatase
MVLFTDLDGTLLDDVHYSFEPALPALRALRERSIPLVICSGKTRLEIEYYRKKLHNRDPFISENGGGIHLPAKLFPIESIPTELQPRRCGEYWTVALGAAYGDLRRALCMLREGGFPVTGFGDMTEEEVASLTGLSIAEARMARARKFDEPFLFGGPPREVGRLEEAIAALGFQVTRGKFFHILGESNKGRAVSIVSRLYRASRGDLVTVAIGDAPNDIPMLEAVDMPVIVERPGGGHDPRIRLPNLARAPGVGPVGWNRAVLDLGMRVQPNG